MEGQKKTFPAGRRGELRGVTPSLRSGLVACCVKSPRCTRVFERVCRRIPNKSSHLNRTRRKVSVGREAVTLLE